MKFYEAFTLGSTVAKANCYLAHDQKSPPQYLMYTVITLEQQYSVSQIKVYYLTYENGIAASRL